MTTFNARSCDSLYVVPFLQVADLQRMVNMGFLCEEDEIRKDGHRTWYPASTVVGLDFDAPSRKKESKKVDDWTFQLHRSDGRVDGPFNYETIIDLAKSGSISLECELLPPACMSPIKLGLFRTITVGTPLQRLHVKWDNDKTDGPMQAKLVQDLVESGVVPESCLVRGEDESEWCDYSSYEFKKQRNDRKVIAFRKPETEPKPEPIIDTKKDDDLIQALHEEDIEEESKPVVSDEQLRDAFESVNRIDNYKHRSPYKTISTLFIILTILYGGFLLTTTVISGWKGDNPITNQINKLSDATDPPTASTGNATQATANTPTVAKPTTNKSVQIQDLGFGPMWIHDTLNIPIFGAYVHPNVINFKNKKYGWYPEVWMPQMFFVDSKSTKQSGLPFKNSTSNKDVQTPTEQYVQIKGYYKTEKYGEEKWCWEKDDQSPTMSYSDQELFAVGKWMGLDSWGGDNFSSNNPAIPWLVSETKLLTGTIDIHSEDDVVKTIRGENRGVGIIRDHRDRAVKVTWFDKYGNDSGDLLSFSYNSNNKPIAIDVFSDQDQKDNTIRFVPTFYKNRLSSMRGEGHNDLSFRHRSRLFTYIIDVVYTYDKQNRITNATLQIVSEKINKANLTAQYTFTTTLHVMYTYDTDNVYWSSATLSGSRLHTKPLVPDGNTIVSETKLSPIRYKRTIVHSD